MVKRFHPVSQNHLNPVKTGVEGCLYPVYRVEWLKLSDFGIGWSKPNCANSLMAKNGLFPKKFKDKNIKEQLQESL
jgi:hypothetical protein